MTNRGRDRELKMMVAWEEFKWGGSASKAVRWEEEPVDVASYGGMLQ